jgi:murein DD-endopeptidase MepM/ murein hydrolase activator NlpD
VEAVRRHTRLAVASFSLLAPAGVASGQLLSFDEKVTCPDRSLSVEEVEDGRFISLRAHRRGLLEATVAISASMVNIESSVPLPVTADVYADGPTELTRLRPRSLLQGSYFSTRVRWVPGRRGGVHDDSHLYSLPYDGNRSFVVLQAAMGAFSHGAGSGAEQAVDFGVPAGFTVRAARGGVVVAVRQDSALGGPEKRFESCANYVVVRHPDGTYGNYAHLARHSALVEVGQTVEEGAALGLSGNTGFASGPHLHFDVYRPIDGALRETIAVAFRTTAGVVRALQPGEEYASP